MHPLTPDLSQLKDVELQKKHDDLLSRLNQAYRFGQAEIVMQIQSMLEDYRMELDNRQRALIEELAKKSGKEFNNIIDIQ